MGDYLAGVAVSVVKFLSHLHYFSYNVESTRCALRDEKTETEQSGKSSIIFLSFINIFSLVFTFAFEFTDFFRKVTEVSRIHVYCLILFISLSSLAFLNFTILKREISCFYSIIIIINMQRLKRRER